MKDVDAYISFLPVNARVGGGKAASLARLAQCQLPVPQGFVCTDKVFRQWLGAAKFDEAQAACARVETEAFPEGFVPELNAALATLTGPRFSVRSSFALEDEARSLAAGVFESFVNVEATQVVSAVRRVWLSALSPAAIAYLSSQGHTTMPGPTAVLIHSFVEGTSWGHVAATAHGQEEALWIKSGTLSPELQSQLHRHALHVAAHWGPSELEWVCLENAFTFLQWRPYTPPARAKAWQPSTANTVATEAAPDPSWHWDSSHNPGPLSPAHIGLVELVQAQCQVGYDQRVCGGYLFYRQNDQPPPSLSTVTLDSTYVELEARIMGDLAALGKEPTLEAALATFLSHYATLVGSLGRDVRQGRQALWSFVEAALPTATTLLPPLLSGLPSRATERQVCFAKVSSAPSKAAAASAWQDYVRLFGDDPVAWDVMASTQSELPVPWQTPVQQTPIGTGDKTLLAAELRRLFPPDLRILLDQHLHTAQRCMARGEDDDWLYARLQAPIRHALLRLGQALVQRSLLTFADDVFFLPFHLARALARAPYTPVTDLRLTTAQAKTLHARQQLNPPPARIQGFCTMRGQGTGGRIVGRVHLHKTGQHCQDAKAVVVATSLLPTELPLIQAAAFVVETGGVLDHVAAQARERRLPAVVGVANVTRRLREGDLVLVDADAGVVVPL